MRTRRSILRNRDESCDGIPPSTSVSEEGDASVLRPGVQSTSSLVREDSGMIGRLRSRFTMETDLRDCSPSQPASNELNEELHRLREQNLQLKRGRRTLFRAETASCHSTDTVSSRMSRNSLGTVRSCPSRREPATSLPSTSAAEPSCFTHPLNTLSLLPKPRRLNVLETLVRAFPITIPTEEFVQFVDSKGHPDLTGDMKRYFVERKDQHRTEFERCISVFKSERPWEPKWFTNFLCKLLVSTKARPNVYQYMFDMREREEESKVLQKWRKMSGYIKWAIFVSSFLIYFVMLCFLIEVYGDEGVNMAVPVTLFITIVLNKVLVNMSSSLPSGL